MRPVQTWGLFRDQPPAKGALHKPFAAFDDFCAPLPDRVKRLFFALGSGSRQCGCARGPAISGPSPRSRGARCEQVSGLLRRSWMRWKTPGQRTSRRPGWRVGPGVAGMAGTRGGIKPAGAALAPHL